MSSAAKEQLIQYRLEQAKETLREARTLLEASLLRGVLNRSYYAMFYAVLALGALKQFSTSKHSGMIAFFDSEYVKPGIFPKSLSRTLHRAFDQRQSGDYGEILSFSQEEATQALSDAEEFVGTVTKYLNLHTTSKQS